MRPRRFLPSLSLLIAFEAVVRHGSISAAARELHLTQGAVSRLVQNLEAQLGAPLFLRQRRRLIPTEAARSYARDVGRALDMIQRASTTVVANPQGGTLTLAVLPTFATRWLAPRMTRFLQAHPGISINLATRTQRFGFDTELFDAVIYFGGPDWPGARHLKLFDERLTACAAPGLMARIAGPGDLAGLPLLRLESRPSAWPVWFAAQGLAPPPGSGMVMDQFSMMIQAAISGLGVALLPEYLAAAEIAEGRLHPVGTRAVPGTGAYWLAWPAEKDHLPPLAALRDWLAGQPS